VKKELFAIAFSLFSSILFAETVKTIGSTHYGSQELPFGMYYGYERSASLFLFSEIGSYCYITKLGWEVQAGNPETCPVKIYLKQTSQVTLTSTSWDLLVDGATLVYDAATSFPSSGWQTIDIADFGYSATNLLVLCETDYGAPPPLNYPWFWYSLNSSNRHQYWRNNDLSLLGSGTVNKFRPNIQITYSPASSHMPPSGFLADAAGSSQVNLGWTKNSTNDNVIIAYNSVNAFGTPSGTYVPGNIIAGGGTVIYNGSGTSFSQTDGLAPATTYYYMAWSVYSSPPSYSTSGTSASATTFCGPQSSYPYAVDFEPAVFPPSCWALAAKSWIRAADASGFGTGTASAKADFFSNTVGNFDLVSPDLDLTSLNEPMVKFDHAYATYDTQLDRLELWYSSDGGASYTLQCSWLGGPSGPLNTGGTVTTAFIPTQNQWAAKSCSLPAGTNKIKFRGVTAHGNNLYVDNIQIYDNALPLTWTGAVSSSWNNAQNWIPNEIPDQTHMIIIQLGSPYNLQVSTSGLACKKLTINNGGVFSIGNGTSFSITGDLLIMGGGVINNNGSVSVGGNLDVRGQQ
jgi:hypothetical protein